MVERFTSSFKSVGFNPSWIKIVDDVIRLNSLATILRSIFGLRSVSVLVPNLIE
jgi:hypothetical protein